MSSSLYNAPLDKKYEEKSGRRLDRTQGQIPILHSIERTNDTIYSQANAQWSETYNFRRPKLIYLKILFLCFFFFL